MQASLTRVLALIGTFAAAFASFAQPPSEPASPPAAQSLEQTLEVTDEEIETFATIYVELQETAERFEQEISEVESEEEAQAVQARMQQASINALEKHGWTPDRFNQVAEALNRNPEQIEKTLRLIEEKS
jgi:phage shock protein A